MKQPSPKHCDLDYFATVNGCLQIGGIPLQLFAERVGGTPFYAYDRKIIDARVQNLRETFPDTIKLHYAIKANPMPELVDHLAQQVDGLDVASLGELRVALDSSTPSQHISFTGPGKGVDELRVAIESGVTLNLESETEMLRVAQLAKASGSRPRVTVRINPDFELKSSGMRMGGGPKQFGIDTELVPGLLQKLKTRPLS